MSRRLTTGWGELARIFIGAGARSFGGWSTLALLLEKELVDERGVLTKQQLHGAVAYAQVLPGATQVAIASNAGYKLRGVRGAFVATICYLLPALSLITVFAALYFHVASSDKLMAHTGGLIAALGGVILANAYNVGGRHVAHPALWLLVVLAFVAKLVLGVNTVFIVLSFGLVGFLGSLVVDKRRKA